MSSSGTLLVLESGGHVVVQLYFWVQFYICTSVIVSNLLSYITKPQIKGKSN